MEAAWISKNYIDDLYLQCTYTCIRVLDRRLAHASKKGNDVNGLAETRRRQPFKAICDTEKQLFLGACDGRGVGGVGVLVNTTLIIFVVYAPTSNYDEEEVEASSMDLEKVNSEDHTFFKGIIGDFNAKTGPRRMFEKVTLGPTD
ncbi:unnamed protein product [Angiostrongylus costaricensis]|uniref:Endo/exonuclease/phosphatase domain-containing protein n=1 Tax=Angiostrongylus costaricensis TaxID=334426 RepID=A0A0R3PIG4_ANGCS|nr:unnamed protein product [Angiostrongylus costaricensis]